MVEGNPGREFDLTWFVKAHVNYDGVVNRAKDLKNHPRFDEESLTALHILALTCIDLTTLAGDDTATNVLRLCAKAITPLSPQIIRGLGFDESVIKDKGERRVTTAAVCVYPAQVACAANFMKKVGLNTKVGVASVAAGFPSGQYPLETRLQEIRLAVQCGATEIDIVVDRGLVLAHKWEQLYNEICQMKVACGPAHLKTILAAGELDNFENIYKASMVAMMAGSDFIKTSTGKEVINATLPIGVVMCRAISDYYQRTKVKVGFKPAGGIRTADDAVNWIVLVRELLGNEWLCPKLFRIGASGLLADLETTLFRHVTGHLPAYNQFTLA